ncbi:tetratricopeptide repeat protein [Synechocystis sp. PCC 7509]|uniref:tetratricopeptide repeat protein n=1 Tax=Synechocystis sp. PCC 7509 TaxID=927677 RepID=UPI0002AC4CFE|nr:tetratricopeptide repeat protein [Synechocystis sp. PCC 7509]
MFHYWKYAFIPVCAVAMLGLKPVFAATSASEYRSIGLSYRANARYDQAIAAFKKSVDLEPENASARVLLGWTQHLAGHQKTAAESLLPVVYNDPQYVPALNALGIVYLVNGDVTAAVVTHTWAAMLEPNNEIAYYNLSLSLHQLKLYSLAVSTATKAAQLEPNNPHSLVAKAIAYWSLGDFTSAKLTYRQALNLDPRYNNPFFLKHLQKAAFSQSQIAIAEQILSAKK